MKNYHIMNYKCPHLKFHKDFFDTSEFDKEWSILNKEIINDELKEFIDKNGINYEKDYSFPNYEVQKKWKKIWLMDGNKWTSKAKFFPKTVEMMEKIGGKREILLSCLDPDGHIPKHTGTGDFVTRVHFALSGVDDSGIEMDSGERKHKEYPILIFDDSRNHASYNKSKDDRWVLIFDLPNPYLSEKEFESCASEFKQLINSIPGIKEFLEVNRK